MGNMNERHHNRKAVYCIFLLHVVVFSMRVTGGILNKGAELTDVLNI